MVVGGANLAATFARYGLIDTHRFGNGVVLLNYAAA